MVRTTQQPQPSTKTRQRRRRPASPPQPLPPDFDDIVRHLFIRLRWPINKIARHLQVSHARVSGFLRATEGKTHGLASSIRQGIYHRRGKLSPKRMEALKHDLLTDPTLTHSALARKYSLSRERIRQISVDLGGPTRAQLLAARRKVEEQKRQKRSAQIRDARETKRFQQIQQLKKYWAAGFEVAEIAKRMGLMASTVGVRIVKLRRQYPEDFPFRNVPMYMKHADFYAELDAKAAAAEAKKSAQATPVLQTPA